MSIEWENYLPGYNDIVGEMSDWGRLQLQTFTVIGEALRRIAEELHQMNDTRTKDENFNETVKAFNRAIQRDAVKRFREKAKDGRSVW